MRVLLVQPPLNFEQTYPLGLAYLAGTLRRQGIEVEGFDARRSPRGSLERLLADRRYDVVGVSAYSTNLRQAARIARSVRQCQPTATLIVGGPHATLAPEDTAALTACHFVVRGDGEEPLLRLLLGDPDAPGVHTPGRPAVPASAPYVQKDLDALALPDREVFPVAAYYRSHLRQQARWTAMITSRGCHLPCRHCAAPALSRYCHRTRSPAAVIEELRQLQRDHGVEGVYLEDDNLLLDRTRALALFEAIGRLPSLPRLELPNGVPPALLDGELLVAMRRANVRAIALGVESLLQGDLEALRRPCDHRHLLRLLDVAREQGIRVTAYFMIGLPGHSLTTVIRGFPAWRRLPFDQVHASVFRQLPGVAYAAQPSAAERISFLAARDLFYLYYYSDLRHLLDLLGREGWSAALVAKAVRRYLDWLAARQ